MNIKEPQLVPTRTISDKGLERILVVLINEFDSVDISNLGLSNLYDGEIH